MSGLELRSPTELRLRAGFISSSNALFSPEQMAGGLVQVQAEEVVLNAASSAQIIAGQAPQVPLRLLFHTVSSFCCALPTCVASCVHAQAAQFCVVSK